MSGELSEAFSELRSRNIQVPKPARLPTPNEFEDAASEVGVPVHPDLKRYFLTVSDVFVGTLEPATITNPEWRTHWPNVVRSARAYGVPPHLLPFCEDNADFYCMDAGGRVIFWSHNGSVNESWENMASWIYDVWLGEG